MLKDPFEKFKTLGILASAQAGTGLYEDQGDNWWVDTEAEYYSPLCSGSRQSPIVILTENQVEYTGSDMLSFSTSYCEAISGFFENNGNTLQFNIKAGAGDAIYANHPSATSSYITGGPLGDNKYHFWQYHFHWGNSISPGAEHVVDTHSFPAEVHLVHVHEDYLDDPTGAYADPEGLSVLGIFIVGGATNATFFDKVSDAAKDITESGNYTTKVPATMNLNQFVNHINPGYKQAFNYWHYEGSLTTPPCSEAVMWLIAEHPLRVTDDQVLISFISISKLFKVLSRLQQGSYPHCTLF